MSACNRLKLVTGLRGPGLSLILPFWEGVGGYLDLSPKARSITVSELTTRDQAPVSVSVSLIYRVDPWAVRPKWWAEVMDSLETSAAAILQRQVEHRLRELVGGTSLNTLLGPGFRTCVEERLTQELPGQVGDMGIVLLGPVMLGPISLPASLQAQLNQAIETRIHAQARAEALNTLGEALGGQPDPAWEKVMEAEALEMAGRNGAPLWWPYAPGWGMGGDKGGSNGKS